MKRAFLLTAMLVFFAAPAVAQDPTEVDPDHYTVEFETDDFRLLKISYGPGESSVMHAHNGGWVIFATDAHVMMHGPDGEHVETTAAAGQSGWADATVHAPENLSDEPLLVYLIELVDDEYDEEDYDHDDDDDDDEDEDD